MSQPSPSLGPPLYAVPAPRSIGGLRRLAARTLDWLLVGTLSALVCWPLAWSFLADAAQRRGTSFAWDVVNGSSDLSGSAAEFVDYARTVILLTLIGQVLLVGVYEWLCLSTIETTVGKAVLGIQVVMPTADGTPAPRGERFGRFAVRATLAVLPGGIAVAFFAVAVLGVEIGWLVGLAFLGVATIDFLATRRADAARRCLHDRAARTLVVPRRLAQLAKNAAAQARVAGAQTAYVAQQAGESEFARRAAERSRESLARARASAWGQYAESGGKKAWSRLRQRGKR